MPVEPLDDELLPALSRVPSMCNKYVAEMPYKIRPPLLLVGSDEEDEEGYATQFAESLEINPTNLRIWIHEKDMNKLERVLWEGQGQMLLNQSTAHARVRRFLDAVPKLMNDVREIHESAVTGDVAIIRSKEYRIPVYSAKDINGISAFHKAVVNGHLDIAEYLMEKTDRGVLELTDRQGRTALHYAAGNSAEDGRRGFHWLVDYGADKGKADEMMHVPSFYFNHSNQIRLTSCSFIPEAPRITTRERRSSEGERGKDDSSPRRGNTDRLQQPRNRSRSTSNKRSQSREKELQGIGGNKALNVNKAKEALPQWNKITKEQVSKWVKTGDLVKLEHAVYMGKGNHMKGRTAWNEETRKFLNTVPNIQSSIEHFHSLASEGNGKALDKLLTTDRKLIGSRDSHGRTALHKAARAGHVEIVNQLLNGDLANADDLVKALDKEIRSPLHYAARCEDPDIRRMLYNLLHKAGGDKNGKDSFGNPPEYYEDNEFLVRRREAPVEEELAEGGDSSTAEGKAAPDGEATENLTAEEKAKLKGSTASYRVLDAAGAKREASEAVEAKDWERLVRLVLDGHGDDLQERSSKDEEVQEFIDNVNAFQEKILNLSRAVDRGSLRDVQTQLDRKKFALIRDKDTGVNLLQKAIILEHSDIVRYLASNFPKILDLVDVHGRTAIHYAAVLAKKEAEDEEDDNYYQFLLYCGGDTETEDYKGGTASSYLEAPPGHVWREMKDLVQRAAFEGQLGGRPGRALELVETSKPGDKSDDAASRWKANAARRARADAPPGAKEEDKEKGKEKPTFKGQAHNSFDEAYETSDYEDDGTIIVGKDGETKKKDKSLEKEIPKEVAKRLDVAFRKLTWARESPSLMKRFLTKKVFERLKGRVSAQDTNLFDIICSGVENLDAEVGAFASDPDDYRVFWPLFKPIIASYHGITEKDLKQSGHDWGELEELRDFHGGDVVQMVEFSVSRSISGYPLLPKMNFEDFKRMEQEMKGVFNMMLEDYGGNFYSFRDISKGINEDLEAQDALFERDEDELLRPLNCYREWPVGRGVFMGFSKKLVIWLNAKDHIKIMARSPTGELKTAFELLQICTRHHLDVRYLPNEEEDPEAPSGDREYEVTSCATFGKPEGDLALAACRALEEIVYREYDLK